MWWVRLGQMDINNYQFESNHTQDLKQNFNPSHQQTKTNSRH